MISGVKIVGLGYKIGAGKDAVADILCSKFGFVKMSFADSLKEAVSAIFGWPRGLLNDQEFKATEDPFWGLTPRTVLQRVGTEAMRNNIREDVWVKSLERRVKNHAETENCTCPSVVIPDMRFPNEVAAVKRWGGIAVRVDRPINTWTPNKEENAGHASEQALSGYDDWDYVIDNSGTLADLEDSAEAMLWRLYRGIR